MFTAITSAVAPVIREGAKEAGKTFATCVGLYGAFAVVGLSAYGVYRGVVWAGEEIADGIDHLFSKKEEEVPADKPSVFFSSITNTEFEQAVRAEYAQRGMRFPDTYAEHAPV